VASFGVASLVALTLVVAGMLVLSRGNLAFAVTVLWALVAIVVAASTRGHAGAITTSAIAAMVAVVAITVIARRFGARAV
jgi:hypothetical protein